MVDYLKILNKLLLILNLVFGIFFFFFPYRTKWFFMFFIISIVPAIYFFYIIERLGLGEKYKFYAISAIWLNHFGELYFYDSWQYYDKVLHFFIPMLLAHIIFVYLRKNKFPNRFVAFLMVMGIEALFEIWEYIPHTFLGFQMLGVMSNGIMVMSPITDTIIDLFLGALGTFIFLYFILPIRNKKNEKEM